MWEIIMCRLGGQFRVMGSFSSAIKKPGAKFACKGWGPTLATTGGKMGETKANVWEAMRGNSANLIIGTSSSKNNTAYLRNEERVYIGKRRT